MNLISSCPQVFYYSNVTRMKESYLWRVPAEPDTSLKGLPSKYFPDLMLLNLVFEWELVYLTHVGYTMHQQNLKFFVGSPI
jgi:hypothetical protein